MFHPSQTLDKLRDYKEAKSKQFFPQNVINTYTMNDCEEFEPWNSREKLAWQVWYLRGIEAAEEYLAKLLIPELIEDE